MTIPIHPGPVDRPRGEDGVTLVEFALIAPVLCLMLVGMFDFGFQVYAQSAMQGAVHNAARSSTLEGGVGRTSSLDDRVAAQVGHIVPQADITFARKNYATFSDIGRPEDFTDTNGNSRCDDDEPFEDLNRNGIWDADRGAAGLGGARDAVVYSATARFDRVFPLHGFLGLDPAIVVTGSTVLRNQPYQDQGRRDPVVGQCS